MTKITAKLGGFGLALGLLPGLALAQTATGTQEQNQMQDQMQSDQQNTMPHHMGHHGGKSARASKLIGSEVQSSQGEALGQIADIVVDPQTGQITFAVLQSPGTAGATSTKRAIPWKSLHFAGGGQQATTDISQSKLQSGPALGAPMSELDSPDYAVEIYQFYGVEPSSMGGSGQGMGGMEQGQGGGQPQPYYSNPPPNTPPQ